MNSNQATMQKMEQLGLFGMLRAFRATMESGIKSQFTSDELVSHLVDNEWDERHNRKLQRLLKAARFRYHAGMEDLDFSLRRNLEKNLILRLCDCRWVEEHQSVILTGPCGCGKSFLVSALGHQACIHGYSTLYFSASKLFSHLKLCKADGSYLKEIARIQKRSLLIVDDFGLEPLDAPSRMSLLEIIEDRHGRASLILASQFPVAQWHPLIGEPTIADAICDRIVHTAHRIELKGESVRKLYAQRSGEKKKGEE